jgi:osmotically-inducible protein OsmY
MQTPTQLTLAALAALVLFAGCDRRHEDGTVGQKVDGAVNTVEKKAEDAKDATARAAAAVGDKAKDMGITAAINAELARDARLSAVRINVDTVDGRVTLRGSAPDAAAREHATALANSVSGVVAVDNQLSIEPHG